MIIEKDVVYRLVVLSLETAYLQFERFVDAT